MDRVNIFGCQPEDVFVFYTFNQLVFAVHSPYIFTPHQCIYLLRRLIKMIRVKIFGCQPEGPILATKQTLMAGATEKPEVHLIDMILGSANLSTNSFGFLNNPGEHKINMKLG